LISLPVIAKIDNVLDRRQFLQLSGLTAAGLSVASLFSPAVAAPSATSTPSTGAYSADVAVQWFERLRQLVRVTLGFSPPVAARAYGHAGVTLYQAVVPGMPTHRSLAGQLTDLTWTPGGAIERGQWPLVANAALAEITRRLFPTAPATELAAVDALEASLAESLGADVEPLWRRTARLRGYAVAAVVFEWSKSDGGHEAYLNLPSGYTPPTGPGLWVPTPPAYLPALVPYWGHNRTMVSGLVSRTLADPPPPYSSDPTSAFYTAATEVYATGRNLTDEQRAIALFWADGAGTPTPAGHWVSILSQYLTDIGAPLDVAAEAYARLGIAVNDAFIACWNTKYTYNVLRPVTYIQSHIDATWSSLLVTPPFPEYTSGHSVQSASSARVLIEQFGAVAFTDGSRSFSSFEAAAVEAAISRLYGGIHYRFGIENGVDQGREVGDEVNSLQWRR
jgi:PAP2 superfamily